MTHQLSHNEILLRRILKQYQQPLYWHVRHIVGTHEDAEDVMQESFIRAYRHIDKLRNSSSEKAWLYRIATNEAMRLIESRQLTADVADHDPIQEETPDYDNLQQALSAAIELLPPRQRAVFCMRYYDEMEYEDIASVTESNIKAVTVNYHHAKERIRQYLLSL